MFGISLQQLAKQQKIILFQFWLGWALDGYELVLMLFVISSINQLFFPSNNPSLSLFATFATYVVTLIMRPFGGAFFGNFGDKYGRKKCYDNNNHRFFCGYVLYGIITYLTNCRNFSTNFVDNYKILARLFRWR